MDVGCYFKTYFTLLNVPLATSFMFDLMSEIASSTLSHSSLRVGIVNFAIEPDKPVA